MALKSGDKPPRVWQSTNLSSTELKRRFDAQARDKRFWDVVSGLGLAYLFYEVAFRGPVVSSEIPDQLKVLLGLANVVPSTMRIVDIIARRSDENVHIERARVRESMMGAGLEE